MLLVRKISTHESDIQSLSKRIEKLEDRLGSNEKLADTLCETANKAVKMREMLETNFVQMLSKDDKAKQEIKTIIEQTDRDFVQTKLKQYGTWIGAGILFLAAQASIQIVGWFFKSFSQ